MGLDLMEMLSPEEWLCCHWSLLAIQNSSLALGPDSTRSVTQAEFVDHISGDASVVGSSHQSTAVPLTHEASVCALNGSRSVMRLVLGRCYASWEAIVPVGRRFQPSSALVAAGLVLLVAGIAANVLVCCTIGMSGRLRTRKNAFMLNLALADILVLTVCAPYSAQFILINGWQWEAVMCKLVPFIQGSLMSVSIWSQASVAFYRYVVVCHPIRARMWFTSRCLGAWIGCVWLLSVLLCTPNLLSHSFSITKVMGIFLLRQCSEDKDRLLKRCFTVALLICLYLLPGSIISTFCALTIRSLNRSLQFLARNSRQAAKQSRRLQTARLFIGMLIGFAMCWGPYHCLTVWLHIWQQQSQNQDRKVSDWLHLAQFTSLALGYVDSVLNPCILLGCSAELRQHAWLLVTLRWRPRTDGSSRERFTQPHESQHQNRPLCRRNHNAAVASGSSDPTEAAASSSCRYPSSEITVTQLQMASCSEVQCNVDVAVMLHKISRSDSSGEEMR